MSMEPKKTVLIVEDEMNIVDIVRVNLQREGYDTLEAYDGEAGLALAREKKPDLILLDVMMPKMMGLDVCRALRAEGDNVPVIILTAREEEEDKILGLEIGADAMFKATMVDGVYDKDPHKYADAVRYDTLTFTRVLDERLAVMDSTAATLCRDNGLPILVFDLCQPANIAKAVKGESVGTLVSE